MSNDEFHKIIIPAGGPLVYLDPNDIAYISKDVTEHSAEAELENEQRREFIENTFIESSNTRDLLERAFKFGLSPKERDIFELYFFENKTQDEIGQLLDLSQRTVSYRITKGIERIKYFLFVDSIDFQKMRDDLEEILDPSYVHIIVGVITTSSQTTIGQLLNLSQSMVRWRFFKALDTIKEQGVGSEKYREYANMIDLVSSNFSIIKNKFKDF
jgi:DNA-directed RNA polymerase specialized sigma24 family protein